MKILIIGSKGSLGRELVKVFSCDKNYQVLAWSRKELDITDKKNLEEKILKAKSDIIINASAYNAVDKAEEKKEFDLAKKVNGEAPGNLAKVAKKLGAVFCHYSTDYVFDGKKGKYKEDDKTNPISNYGISKELGEKNIKKFGDRFYIIRTSKLFGNTNTSGGGKKSFFDIMFKLAKNNEELKVIDSERSCFTYVVDLACATKKLIEEKHSFGIYHLVNKGAVTWYEGLKECFKIAKIKNVKITPVKADFFQRPAERGKSTILLNTKFPKLRNYREAIKEWFNESL